MCNYLIVLFLALSAALVRAQDIKGREFCGAVSDLAGQGVEFRVCNNTLVSRNIDRANVLLKATLAPSGVAEATRLQIKEGFAYLKH